MGKLLIYNDPSSVRIACAEARKARLFIPGWSLFDTFVHAENHSDSYAICFYEEGGVKIGFGVVEKEVLFGDGKYMQVFVRKQHRRKGIGRQIVGILAKIEPDFSYGEGNKGSINFWNNVT